MIDRRGVPQHIDNSEFSYMSPLPPLSTERRYTSLPPQRLSPTTSISTTTPLQSSGIRKPLRPSANHFGHQHPPFPSYSLSQSSSPPQYIDSKPAVRIAESTYIGNPSVSLNLRTFAVRLSVRVSQPTLHNPPFVQSPYNSSDSNTLHLYLPP